MPVSNFYGLLRDDVAEVAGSLSRSNHLYRQVYRSGVTTNPEFGFTLPRTVEVSNSADGVRKFLVQLQDGHTVECVRIPEPSRVTFCVSSQVGCALACQFCLTGQLGLSRSLTTAEIVGQVVTMLNDDCANNSPRLSIVFMGMGEPLQNYENVIKSIRILSDHYGLAIPIGRITLSTAGLVPGLQQLAVEPIFPNLSISLTGARNTVRDELMPINKKYPLEDVIAAVRTLSEQRRKRVMFEYVLIKGVTDSVDDAHRLAALLRGLRSKVNLIPLNESDRLPFHQSDRETALAFQRVLLESGIATFIRRNRGNDVLAACGQLKVSASAKGER